jgi:cyanate permease
MFNLRIRTTLGSAAIAGFAMGIGYLAGTLGPLLGGWLTPSLAVGRWHCGSMQVPWFPWPSVD